MTLAKAFCGLHVIIIMTGMKTLPTDTCSKGDFLGLPLGPKYVYQLWTKLLKSVFKYLETIIAFQRGRVQLLGQLAQLGCVTKKALQDKKRDIL